MRKLLVTIIVAAGLITPVVAAGPASAAVACPYTAVSTCRGPITAPGRIPVFCPFVVGNPCPNPGPIRVWPRPPIWRVRCFAIRFEHGQLIPVCPYGIRR